MFLKFVFRVSATCLVLTLGSLQSLTVFAQPATYPNKPVKMIIPFAPGGASDFIGRILSVKLSEVLGQQVIVDNRTGAAGNIGMEAAAKAAIIFKRTCASQFELAKISKARVCNASPTNSAVASSKAL